MIKPKTIALLLLLLLAGAPFPQSGLSPVALSYNPIAEGWVSLSLLALLISLFIVALSYMASIGLDLPQLKAWTGAELGQVFVSALIIISLIAVFNFLSATTLSLAEEGDFSCSPQVSEPYTVSVAKCYLDSLTAITNSTMKSTLFDAFDNAKKASERDGKSTNSIYTLWYAYFTGKNAGYSIYVDRYSYDFEILSGIYTSLYSQRVFLERIIPSFSSNAWSLASVLLFYGVILRTFFFSRKLGGLLLAIGISLLLVWPLTYSLSWFTLKVAVFGDQMVAPLDENCPDECLLEPPKTYNGGATPSCNDACKGTQEYFDSEGKGICPNTGNECTAGSSCGTVACPSSGECPYTGASCTPLFPCGIPCSPHEGAFSCPSACRELPYPVQNPGCTNSALMDESEGNYGYMADGIDVRAICKTCPDECKVGGTVQVPARERTTCYSNDLLPDPTPEVELLLGEAACEKTDNPDVYAPTNPSATNTYLTSCYTEGCAIKYPQDYNSEACYDSCIGAGGTASPICPDFCRVYYFDPDEPDTDWRIPTSEDFQVPTGQEEWAACDACTVSTCDYTCRFAIPDPERLDCETLCTNCPQKCRVQGLGTSTYFDTACDDIDACDYNDETNVGCPQYCKLAIPAEGTSIPGDICDAGGFCLDGSACASGSTCTDGIACPTAQACSGGGTCTPSFCPGTQTICMPGSECPNFQICPQSTCPSIATCATYPSGGASSLPAPISNTCNACPEECRVSNPPSGCPNSCSDANCALACKSPYSPASPPSLCDSCLNCDDDCATIPQIRTNCVEMCNLPNAASKDFTPAGFVSTGGAQTTMTDVKNVGMLAVPAIVLPLFNIVITLAFIRILSQTLGGDVEIPGLARIL